MPQKSNKTQRKRRTKKSKFQRKLDKWIPYFIVVLFTYTLYTTQFFHFFSQSQREAHDNHLAQESDVSLIFNFSRPQDVMDIMMNFQKYFTQMMTNIDLNQMYSFLHDGFAFSGNVRDRGETRQHPTEYRFVRHEVRRDQLRFDEDQLTQNPHTMPISEEPLVYIFNSHPTEMIGTTRALAHIEGEMNVLDMSRSMAQHLESYGIPSLVEERCLQTRMREEGVRNWYDGSRIHLEESIAQYESLTFFFDLHRDALPPGTPSEIEFEGKSYAMVLIVIGSDNEYQQESRAIALEIERMLEERVPGISRGVRNQGGLHHHGIYNQDISPMLQLFEIGNYTTTAEAAENTIRVLSSVLAELIRDHGF